MTRAQVAVIGGSGFYDISGLSEVEAVRPDTPFGATSDAIVLGRLEGVDVAFLPRHGVGHRILPSELPVRANIWALKELGVERIVSVSAVGSMKEEIEPLHLVVPDQLIDRTRGRPSTFFGDGLVAHIAFDEPFCPQLSETLAAAARSVGATAHRGGTYVAIEGPAFSTKAESLLYRSWDASVIGMTAVPEAKLAREAEICYATLGLATDYDTWHDKHDAVSAELIIANLQKNVETARAVIVEALRTIQPERTCACPSALATALVTSPEAIPEQTKRDLAPIVGRYLSVEAAS